MSLWSGPDAQQVMEIQKQGESCPIEEEKQTQGASRPTIAGESRAETEIGWEVNEEAEALE